MFSKSVNGVVYSIRNPNDVIEKTLLNGHQWNRSMFQFLLTVIKDSDVKHIVNVGSHIGSIALPISYHLESVTAYEANPKTFDHLCHNKDLNGIKNVTCVNVALGNCDGKCFLMSDSMICPVEKINRVQNNSGGVHVFTQDEIDKKERSSNLADLKTSVTMKRLDDVHTTGRIDVLLVDIEGAEFNFLQGARKTIAQYKPIIIMEIWDNAKRQQENMKRTREQMVEYVCKMGYRNTMVIGEEDFVFEPLPERKK